MNRRPNRRHRRKFVNCGRCRRYWLASVWSASVAAAAAPTGRCRSAAKCRRPAIRCWESIAVTIGWTLGQPTTTMTTMTTSTTFRTGWHVVRSFPMCSGSSIGWRMTAIPIVRAGWRSTPISPVAVDSLRCPRC